MNIMVFTGRYPPDHSGAGLRILRTYQDLAHRHGITYRIVAEPVRLRDGKPDLPGVTRLSSTLPAPILIYKIFSLLKKHRHEISLVHCIGPTKLTVMAALLCRMMKIPYATEISIDYDERRANRPFSRLLLKSFFNPDRAIALTPRIAAMYKNFGFPENKIFIRPNPVMMTQGTAPEKLAGNLNTKYKHLVLGRICERKNQVGALQVLANLPADHGLILAGPLVAPEDPAYLKRVENEIRRLGLSARTLLHPETVENPAALYEKIESLWCFSTQEGLPNVVLESLWMGKPCFINKELGLGGWVIHGGNGAEVPLDAARAAAIIGEKLKTGFDSAAIRHEAREKFDPVTINDKMLALLQAARDNSLHSR